MTHLLPFNIQEGDAPEYGVNIQKDLNKLYSNVLNNIPTSDDKKMLLVKLQEASFWATACISQSHP